MGWGALERLGQALQGLVSLVLRQRLVGPDLLDATLDLYWRLHKGPALRVDALQQQEDVGLHVVVLVQVGEAIFPGDRLKLVLGLRRRHLPLCGNEAFHLLLGQWDSAWLPPAPSPGSGRPHAMLRQRSQWRPTVGKSHASAFVLVLSSRATPDGGCRKSVGGASASECGSCIGPVATPRQPRRRNIGVHSLFAAVGTAVGGRSWIVSAAVGTRGDRGAMREYCRAELCLSSSRLARMHAGTWVSIRDSSPVLAMLPVIISSQRH